jgi:hypothetical protein
LGVVVCAVLGIYTTYISINVISHIDQGLGRSFDLASEAFDIPAFLLEMYFFSLPVIGASAIFGLKRLMRPPGILEIHTKGILLACYSLSPISPSGSGEWFPWGFVEWGNLASTSTFRLCGIKCLGLRFIDLQAFLRSRDRLQLKEFETRPHLDTQWARSVMDRARVAPIGNFVELVWTLRGLTAPKSMEEEDLLRWNQENYGFHVIVPNREIPCGARALVEMIEKQRQSAKTSTATRHRFATV